MDHLVDIGMPPDFGLTQDGDFLVDEVTLGDGYVQRRPKGINPFRRNWAPTWSMLSLQQKDDLCDFLHARLGVEPFLFTDPDNGRVYKVVCKKPPQVGFLAHGVYGVSAQFTEDFNP